MQEIYSTLPIGTILRKRYVVECVLVQGRCSAIYLVRDKRDAKRLFALKEVSNSGSTEQKRVRFEAKALKRLNHPALPRVYDVFDDKVQGRVYIFMEYIEGSNLETLRREQPEQHFSLSQGITLIAPIINAVTYLHNQQPPVIHKNINPFNTIVPKTGIATMLVGFHPQLDDTDPTTIAIQSGTPTYTTPEQYGNSREISPRTDIYALGAVIYTLFTGIVPANALYRLIQLSKKKADPLIPVNQIIPTVPTSTAKAIHRAMSISSSERFSTIEQFWEALWQVLNDPP